MWVDPKKDDIDEILADIHKAQRNRTPTESKYSITYPYFVLADCTKLFCVANKWWDTLSHNSDGTNNHTYVHWYNHFKGLYDTNNISHVVLKMADNHLRILYSHHILKHVGNHYPYFDYDENNRRSNWIKADDSVSK